MARLIKISILAVSLFMIAQSASAQTPIAYFDYVRADLDWYTLETENFKIHYHSDSSEVVPWTATQVAQTAQEVYEPITALYDYEPEGKTSIIIRDFEDYSNGAAYFFDNMIVIWAPALNSPLRGQHEWIRNVVAHEFTHIVQVQTTLKSSRKRPFTYFQLLDYEKVRRPDVLYGYPNVIVTYPIPALSNPAWLAEGTAQYQRDSFGFDTWDSHRDMLLRTRILSDETLTLSEMGGFYSHSSIERETVYNQGFAFTLYLAKRFGEDVLKEISQALSSWKIYNIERAIKSATGIEAALVFADWKEELKNHYQNVEIQVGDTTSYNAVTKTGFFNFNPRISPGGERIAYLSNGVSSEGTTHLLVDSLGVGVGSTGRSAAAMRIDVGPTLGYTCSLGHRIVPAVTGRIDWSSDGEKIIYARRRDTKEGYLYSDLFEIDVQTEKSKQLTFEARASNPSYEPGGSRVVFVTQHDGTTNLSVLDMESSAVSVLTTFSKGTQVFEPVWAATDGSSQGWIYFGKADKNSAGIYRIRPTGEHIEAVVDGAADERSPSVSSDGTELYYSSDSTGVFNVYRKNLFSGSVEQITNVIGGAFMPHVMRDSLAYASYSWDGYDIAIAPTATRPDSKRRDVNGEDAPRANIEIPNVLKKLAPAADLYARFDTAEDTEAAAVPSEYRAEFTSFSFYPVIRVDQYVTRERSRSAGIVDRRGRLETLSRNTKIGLYVNSREILDELSFLGGLLIGPTSRTAESFGDYISPSSLLKLERDLFIQFDYRKGLGFSKKRWSPQLSLELFNIRRNVDNGLTIEEFSCTACFPPDTSFADISYNLWELNLTARSKINKFMLAEASYRYSPYRVTTERFFSTEFQQTIGESSSRYFIGKALSAGLRTEIFQRHRHDDVFQAGLKVNALYQYEVGSLLDKFDVEDGLLVPVYENNNVHRVSIEGYWGSALPGSPRGGMHGISARLRASSVLGPPVDSFYNDYVGGLIGARGYPFYALGGNETMWAQISYTIPLFPSIEKQFGFVFVDKLFLRTYVDAAMAWSGPLPSLGSVRKDIGGELRLVTGSFYLLPSAIFVSGTYGFDEFDFQIDDTFVTPGGDETVTYGKSFQVHAGLLFSFDL